MSAPFAAAADESYVHPAHRRSISPFGDNVEDVVIPAHLLQAAGAVTSKRDDEVPRNWEPQRQLTVREIPLTRKTSDNGPRIQRPAAVKRSSTLPSRSSTPQHSRESSLETGLQRSASHTNVNEKDDHLRVENKDHLENDRVRANKKATRVSWRLSYTPGVSERLTVSPRNSALHLDPYRSRSPTGNNHHSAKRTSAASNPFIDPFNPMSRSSSSHSDSATVYPESVYAPDKAPARRGTIGTIVDAMVPNMVQRSFTNASHTLVRSNTIRQTYEKAKTKGAKFQRSKWGQIAFEYGLYAFILLFVYFVLIGIPLWNGAVWWLYWVVANKFVFAGGFSITLGISVFYAFAPLLIVFEDDPPVVEMTEETKIQDNVKDTALLIPCYKSASLIAATLEAALKIFPASHIFVLANGNSPTPLDNTEEICRPYGVNHLWSPVGSKIVAQYVGCYAAKGFKNVLLIDDDCALPENFPVVTDRLKGKVKCLGYTITSVGPNSSKGNYCQQAQDLEYKLSGIQRDFAGRIGSATFPHGAIALWDRELLVKTFHQHPGFSVSEDWFFGHAARQLGCRITMCSSVFVETETPTAVFLSGGGSRGGFGEMTIFSQRFKRWNFFFVNGMWYNMAYILCNWKLGWWEIGAKIFVFQEVYETLLYLMTPFILPISFYVRPSFCGILLASTVIMYLINVIIFNEVHLRRKNCRISWQVLYVYYLPYKIVLTFINVASCYWSLWKYARYFAKRHPKVIEDEKAVEVVVRLEEDQAAAQCGLGRRMTVRTIRENDESVNPFDTRPNTPEQLGVPAIGLSFENGPMNGRLDTPTREMEGIGAFDFSAGPPPRAGETNHLLVSSRSSLRSDADSVYWNGPPNPKGYI